jgi:hypothetical protein
MRSNSFAIEYDRCPLNPFSPPASSHGLALGKVNSKKIVIKKPSGFIMNPDAVKEPRISIQLPKSIIKVRQEKIKVSSKPMKI